MTNQILPDDVRYPVAETIAAVSMFLMLLLEQVRFTFILKFYLPIDIDVKGSRLQRENKLSLRVRHIFNLQPKMPKILREKKRDYETASH